MVRRSAALAREEQSGLIVPPMPATSVHRDAIVALAARYRMPAIHAFRSFVVRGGLMSYGVELNELYRRAAAYVDRLLRGERTEDLPIQQPTMYELVINLKTANTIDLTVPPTLPARADEVIE
jgi:putative tryptophan/tyrosine transport system substrate-binding protein